MRTRTLILVAAITLLGLMPTQAQPGLPIVVDNADVLLLSETILAPGSVTSVAWSPDGTMIAYGTIDGPVWAQPIGNNDGEQRVFTGHTDSVESLAFSADGAVLISGSLDGEVRVWDVASGRLLRVISAPGAIYTVAANPENVGELIFGGEDGQIYQRNWSETAATLPNMVGHSEAVLDLDYNVAQGVIASAGADDTVRLWHLLSGEQLELDDFSHTDDVTSLSLSPDGELLASASLDGTVWVRPTLMDGEPVKIMDVPEDYGATAVDFGGLGDLVAVGAEDSTVYLMSVPEEAGSGVQEVGYLVGHTEIISDVAFSPLGTMIATASLDGSVKLWAVDTSIVFADAQAAPEALCDGAPPSYIAVGQQAQVTITDGTPLRMRQTPGGDIVTRLDEGTTFDVVGGPQCLNNYAWWNIQLVTGEVGWVAEGDTNGYFIEPLPEVTLETLRNVAPGTAGTATLFGTVWHDECDNTRSTAGEGCVIAGGVVVGDGVMLPAEPGIRGVSVVLGIGACPVDNVLHTIQTDSSGHYEFDGLASGRYCVFVDPAMPGNTDVLIPGQWTAPPPLLDDGAAYYTIELQPDELGPALDFGWDYQLAP